MYYVEGSHEAIISHDTFLQVKREVERRAAKSSRNNTSNNHTYSCFVGIVICGECGARYQHKRTAIGTKYEKSVWICNTFSTLGKTACTSQRIPENILVAKTTEVLGLAEFDAVVFAEQISQIQVPSHNLLTFVFRDGHTVDVEWKNPSRRESWTEVMKQTARERQRLIIEGRQQQ